MPYPPELKVTEHAPPGGWSGYRGPVVVFVHGSLDRGASFTRTIRRLADLGTLTYDRRGYQGSRNASPPLDFGAHVEDLLGVISALPVTDRPVTLIGHSLGGDVAIGAAISEPGLIASIGAFEPPMPWLGFRRTPARPWPAFDDDAGVEAERFFRRMVGDATWERMPEVMRRDRRADGPALVADLAGMRGPAPFDVTGITVPVLFGQSDAGDSRHHRETVRWLLEHVPGARLMEVAGSGHGAHLSHPDAFSRFTRRAIEAGADPAGVAVGSATSATPPQ